MRNILRGSKPGGEHPGANPLSVIEIEKHPGGDGDEKAIPTLATHPGFRALMSKLDKQKQYLKTALLTKKHDEIRDVDLLQLGIYWISFLESEVSRATQSTRTKSAARLATQVEMEEFEKVLHAIESVGATSTK